MRRERAIKRVVLLLALLCVAAGDKMELDKWTETHGTWDREGGVLHTTRGIVVYECEGKRRFALSCELVVNEWQEEPSYLGVFWAFKGTRPSEPAWEERQTLLVMKSAIEFKGPPKQSFDVKTALKKPIPINIVSTSGNTEIAVGKTKFTTYVRYSSPNKIALMISGMDAEIRNLRVKVR